MNTAIAIAAGLLWGGGCGYMKYWLLWRPVLRGCRACDAKRIGTNEIASLFINAAVLLAVLWLRPLWPYSFEWTIIAAAIGLSIAGRLPLLLRLRRLETDASPTNVKMSELPDDTQ